MRRKPGRRAQASFTLDADGLPHSECQKCRREGVIVACERFRDWEQWDFYCGHGRRRWWNRQVDGYRWSIDH